MQEQIVGDVGRPLVLLLGAVAAVLLMVCANLASLTLARDVGRRREAAVRVALGAGRGRLARLALTESLALTAVGGALAVLLAHWGLRLLVATAPASLPRLDSVRLDARVLAVAALLALVVGVAFGVLPALRMGRARPADAMRGGRAATPGRVAARRRGMFIGVQVALSTVLLVGTGLLLTSFVRVLRADRGFVADRVLAFDVVLPRTRYADGDATTRFKDRLLRGLAALPGVTSVATANGIPLEGESQVDELVRPDAPPGDEGGLSANIRYVSPAYFQTVSTPLRRGRAFAETDRGRAVTIVSERAARALWPGQDPIGRRLRPGSNDAEAEVIGVVADVRTTALEQEGSAIAYLPHWAQGLPSTTVLLRTTGDAATLAGPVRATLRQLDPSVPVAKVRTLDAVVSAAVAARRFQLALLALFALMALVAASVGIYGVVAQSLASRTREIGVRLSLGARAGDVHRLVLREGMAPVAVGLLAGLVGSVAAGRAAASLLFGVRPADPLTIVVVVVVLAAVAAVACVVPARRATATDLAVLMRPD
jgi:putative ABC transport system permease protein